MSSKLLIQMAAWVDANEPMKHWKWDDASLDATNEDGKTARDYLKDLGHTVRVWHELPPFCEFYDDKPDIFIGIGYGDLLKLRRPTKGLEAGERRCMGVETDYPVAWLGSTVLSSWPGFAHYHAYYRGIEGKCLTVWKDEPGEYRPLGDRETRNIGVISAVDAILESLMNEDQPHPRRGEMSSDTRLASEDTFLCYNSSDRDEVEKIAAQLKDFGITYFIDIESIRPGTEHQKTLKVGLERAQSICIFFGKDGVGPWQSIEIQHAVGRLVADGRPTIPVLLTSCPKKPDLPFAISNLSWVEMGGDSAMENLVWGITGERP